MSDLDGFILVGGASSRMGRTKAELQLGGVSFVDRAALALSAVTPAKAVLIGGRETAGTISDAVYRDKDGNERRGSIVGLFTALKNSRAEWSAVLACDMPFVSGSLLSRVASVDRAGFDAIVPVQSDGRSQPLCALYRTAACLPMVRRMLTAGDWALREVLGKLNTRFIAFDEVADLPNADLFFLNVNTPEDLKRAQRLFAERFAGRQD
ncbi:MAG: molybdenum cofactor guanylyltransferase [Pyrinomonadaceae bacterium]